MSPRCSPSSVLSVSLRYSNCMSLFPLDICTANFGRVTFAVCRVAMEPVEVLNALDGGKKKKRRSEFYSVEEARSYGQGANTVKPLRPTVGV